jgi:hypothetical protein
MKDDITAEQLDAAVSATFHDMTPEPSFMERCELSEEYKNAVASFLSGAMLQWEKFNPIEHPYEYLFACVSTVLSQGIVIGLTLAEQRELERLTR